MEVRCIHLRMSKPAMFERAMSPLVGEQVRGQWNSRALERRNARLCYASVTYMYMYVMNASFSSISGWHPPPTIHKSSW